MRTVGKTFQVPVIEPEETAEEMLACPHCGKEYKTEAALAKHIKDKHPEEPDQPPEGGQE